MKKPGTVNRRQGSRSGHLWQSRFYSCPVAGDTVWTVLRYIQLNPVRARLVERAERSPWSSASIHWGLAAAPPLLSVTWWRQSWTPERWRSVLAHDPAEREVEAIQLAAQHGVPLGDRDFTGHFSTRDGPRSHDSACGAAKNNPEEGYPRRQLIAPRLSWLGLNVRPSQFAFNVNGSMEAGTLTWNANGSLKLLAIVDPFSSSNTQTCTNSYDDLSRLISNQCGAPWGQTFTYDVFGNISKSGTTSFQPTYNLSNRFSTLPAGTPTYDNSGNVLTDGFHTYSWDAAGKTIQIDPGTAAVGMTYDALGRWVERSAGGGFTEAVYGPDGRELALMSAQTVATAYVQLLASGLAGDAAAVQQAYAHHCQRCGAGSVW